MYRTLMHLARPPIEARVTRRAEHEVASANLTDIDAAFGARLGFLRNQLCCSHLTGITAVGMIGIVLG